MTVTLAVGFAHRQFEVEASNRQEAIAKAIQLSGWEGQPCIEVVEVQ